MVNIVPVVSLLLLSLFGFSTKDVNVVLTFLNLNFTKLRLIANQNLQLSKCTPNNYSINIIPFNETSLYQSPEGRNNFQDVHLVFGPNRYYGPAYFGYDGSRSNFNFQTSFFPGFWLDFDTRFAIILGVIGNTLQNDSTKNIIFVVNGSSVNLMEPWKKLNPHKYLSSFRGSLTILYYNDSKDAVRIATTISTMAITNIVLDLNYNASLEVLVACNERNLLNWRQRWMIFFTLLPYKNLLSQINLPLSSNLTIYDFGRILEFKEFFIDEEKDVYLYDIFYVIVKLMDNHTCDQPMPSVLKLGSGTFTYDGQNLKRSTTFLNAFQSSGTLKIVGNVTIDSNSAVSIELQAAPSTGTRTMTEILSEMQSKTFRVAAMLEYPFVYKVDNSSNLTGYSIDTINLILTNLNLTGVITAYNLSTGRLQNGKFSGILGVLQNGQADIAIGPITFFNKYTNYFNFTTKFKPYKLAIIYKKLENNIYQEMFEFIFAFSWEVWVLIIASCVLYAFALTITNLISPNEARMTLFDSFFFTLGSMVQGVTTALPDKVSGRVLVIFWWILNIAILLTYVSNYGSIRSYKRLQSVIGEESDLLLQSTYSYGTVINSSVDEFLASSQSQTTQQIYYMMQTVFSKDMGNLTSNSMITVKAGNYAFIYQDAVLNQYRDEYARCLTLTNGYEQLYYAYALLDGDYTTVINNQLNSLIAQNKLAELDAKYFKSWTEPICVEPSIVGTTLYYLSYQFIQSRTDSLTIQQTAGIFIIMLFGIIISVIVALIEFIVKKFKKVKYEKKPENEAESHA